MKGVGRGRMGGLQLTPDQSVVKTDQLRPVNTHTRTIRLLLICDVLGPDAGVCVRRPGDDRKRECSTC